MTFPSLNNMMTKNATGKCLNAMRYEQKFIARPDGTKLRICVYSPLEPKENVPGVLWMHGGGYAMGIPEHEEWAVKRFVDASGCMVVCPDYCLSARAPYPAALEDCYAALLWLKAHGGAYGMRNDQIMVGGGSAGGGLAAAVTLLARDKDEVSIAYHMPLYPMIDDRMDTASAAGSNAPFWNAKTSRIGWKMYLGHLFGTPEVPIHAAPARAEDLRGMPPACTLVGSLDPFRDETIAYVKKLRAAGVPVTFRLFEGCFHGFDLFCPETEIAKEATAFVTENFRHAAANYFAEQKAQHGPPA